MKGLILTYYGNLTIKLRNNSREVAERKRQVLVNVGGDI